MIGECGCVYRKYTEALRVIRRATTVPPNHKKKAISFHDESLAVQVWLFKSLKLWSFCVDLEESIGTVESTQKAYDTIFELKIANAQNEYWEESFKVYKRGIELFTYPIVFEIWNTYLNKFMKHYQGKKIERARDLFEQVLEKCPEKFVKPIFLLYA
ncbi:Pre-mRNA-splicing factor SYF1 [Puccinia graminis f. sp. tritici]|uniref:Pre-mRNA-splicing factor SYF1 n=1 Tax=Puccinia graminis f. sp. tritici TaxID=56615 RepID=A0A5B0QBE8_PUCGR|nr:Pre-mRNA-splicing factor SYF1 [Puccinia graminis f. sp. tritici]